VSPRTPTAWLPQPRCLSQKASPRAVLWADARRRDAAGRGPSTCGHGPRGGNRAGRASHGKGLAISDKVVVGVRGSKVVEDSTAWVQPDRVVVEALLARAARDEVIRSAIAGIGLARPPQGFTPESTPTQPLAFVWLCLAFVVAVLLWHVDDGAPCPTDQLTRMIPPGCTGRRPGRTGPGRSGRQGPLLPRRRRQADGVR
jgi:hypothetical protein